MAQPAIKRLFSQTNRMRALMILPPIFFLLYAGHSMRVIRSLMSQSSTFHLDYATELVQDYLGMELDLEVLRLRKCLVLGNSPCNQVRWVSLDEEGESIATIDLPFGVKRKVFIQKTILAATIGEFVESKTGLSALFRSRDHEPVYWFRIIDSRGQSIYSSAPTPPSGKEPKRYPLGRSLVGYSIDMVYTSFGPKQLYSVAKTRINFGLIFMLFCMFVFSLFLITRSIRQKLILARQKTFFVTTVSHEFKTPLAIIKLATETLTSGRYHTKEEGDTFLQMITTETNRLDHLVHKVLSFNKIELGDIHFSKRPLALRKLLDSSYAVFQLQAKSEGIELVYDRDKRACPILGDEDLIRHAIDNILDNAFKYRGTSQRIELSCHRKDGIAEVQIRDDGIGMPPGELTNVTKSFYRIDDPRVRGIRGSGLGLAVSRFILERSGVTWSIQSEPGQGTCFTLRFSIHETDLEATEPTNESLVEDQSC